MIIFGKNSIYEYLKNKKNDVKKIFTCDRKIFDIVLKKFKYKNIELLDKKIFEEKLKKFNLKNIVHQNIVAEIQFSNLKSLDELINDCLSTKNKKKIILMLDHIMDPHNFGAIIRSSVFFDISGIIISKNRQAPINATVIKTSAGMAANIDISVVSNLSDALKKLKKQGFWVYSGVAKNGIEPKNIKLDTPIVLVVGNEGDGIHKNLLNNSDFYVTIPGNYKVDSLNVSVSTAIMLYQLFVNEN